MQGIWVESKDMPALEKSDIVRENEDISPLSLNQNSQQCPYITKAFWFLLTWAKKLNQYLNFYQSVVSTFVQITDFRKWTQATLCFV